MDLIDLLTLAGIMLVMAALPSTSVALIVARSVTQGLGQGLAVTLGIVLGDLLFMVLAVFGLVGVATLLGDYAWLLKYLAGLYLVSLGIALLRPSGRHSRPNYRSRADLAGLVAGLLITLADLKALLFYFGLLPAVVDLQRLGPGDLVVLLTVTALVVGSVKFTYAVAAWRARSALQHSRWSSAVQRGAGGVLLGTGAWVVARP